MKNYLRHGEITLLTLAIGALIAGLMGWGVTKEVQTRKQAAEFRKELASLSEKLNEPRPSFGAQRPSGYSGTLLTRLTEGGSESTFNTSPSTLPDGTYLNATNIGDFVVITVNPGAANEEKISASSVSVSSSTATWTVINRGLEFGSTTVRTANKKPHSVGEKVIISNDDQFLTTQYFDKDNPQTVAQIWTFSTNPVITNPCTATSQACNKQYIDGQVSAGAADATTDTEGIVMFGTQAHLIDGTATSSASSSVGMVPQTKFFNATSTTTTTVPVANFLEGSLYKISPSHIATSSAASYTFGGSMTYTGANSFTATSTFSGPTSVSGAFTLSGATFTNNATTTASQTNTFSGPVALNGNISFTTSTTAYTNAVLWQYLGSNATTTSASNATATAAIVHLTGTTGSCTGTMAGEVTIFKTGKTSGTVRFGDCNGQGDFSLVASWSGTTVTVSGGTLTVGAGTTIYWYK